MPEEVELDRRKPYPRAVEIEIMHNPFAVSKAKKGKKGKKKWYMIILYYICINFISFLLDLE